MKSYPSLFHSSCSCHPDTPRKRLEAAIKMAETNKYNRRRNGKIILKRQWIKDQRQACSTHIFLFLFFAHTLFLGPTNEDHSSGVLCRGGGYRRAYVSNQHQRWGSNATLAHAGKRCQMQWRLRDWHCFGKMLACSWQHTHNWLRQPVNYKP